MPGSDVMPQLHLSVDQKTADELARRAASRGLKLSQYLAEIVRETTSEGWPEGYLATVVGSCSSDPLSDPAELETDDIDL